MVLTWRPDRSELGRSMDDPGDGLIYRVRLFPQTEEHFGWIEVTEVFTAVSGKNIQGAMRAWNGIPGKHTVNLAEFLRTIRRGRPSRVEQRRAADQVIEQVLKKLAKQSYQELGGTIRIRDTGGGNASLVRGLAGRPISRRERAG